MDLCGTEEISQVLLLCICEGGSAREDREDVTYVTGAGVVSSVVAAVVSSGITGAASSVAAIKFQGQGCVFSSFAAG